MSLYDSMVDLGTLDVWAYDWFVDQYRFFIEAQLTGNWTALTIEQQEKTIRKYRLLLSALSETMPVQLYWLSMVSERMDRFTDWQPSLCYPNKSNPPPPPLPAEVSAHKKLSYVRLMLDALNLCKINA